MSINWQEIAFSFFGGLGLFLFSIKYMGDALQQSAGDRLRYYIDKYTSNPFLGVLVGIAMSALIQSSSGVTVITVSLVSAGLLTLRQAIGIIMGANIGTTITSFLIGFNLDDYGLPMIFVGSALLFFHFKSDLEQSWSDYFRGWWYLLCLQYYEWCYGASQIHSSLSGLPDDTWG